MKSILIALSFLQLGIVVHAQQMNADDIRKLVVNVDNSLPRGKTFHINYSVSKNLTDFYFERSRDFLKYLVDYRAKARLDPALAAKLSPEATYNGFLDVFKRKLKDTPEANSVTDYSLSDQGFYMKQELFWPRPGPGGIPKLGPTIYVSDGKIMGSFYNDSQGTIQPATERPPAIGDDWTQLAYDFQRSKIAAAISTLPTLSLAQDGPDLKITGEKTGQDKELSQYELRIDRQTLLPREITFIYHDVDGKLYQKAIKRWQFQDFSGFVMPKLVVDELYERGLDDQLRLTETQTLTVNSFSPVPEDSKAALKALLNSNRSIYDEITGSHYLSGNAAQMLDNLSK